MNKNIWNLYKDSQRGKEAIALFTFDDKKDELKKKIGDISKKYKEYLGGVNADTYFLRNCALVINSIYADKIFLEKDENVSEYFTRLIDNLEICHVEKNSAGELIRKENKRPLILQKEYKTFCSILSEISLILYLNCDLFFFPVLFREQFDVFMKILDVLNIPMPELPTKSDKRGRLLLYNELNKNITKFAEANNLTTQETCACIYDFAFMLLDAEKASIDLPEPTNIWLTGGSKEDYKTFLENPIGGAKSVWTCNENTKRGDIIIIYVVSPYSCIQSIWRADIDGVYTPFNYYNSRTRTTNGIVIPLITLKELKADSYFSKLPIVRKNFQGVNGIQFSAASYKELQRLLENKGFDVSVLPKLYNPDLNFVEDLKNEKDVEEKLLIPLLKKIGYSETDWARQLSQKAGRKEKAIPDFVFLPKGEIHFQNAPMIIEAKFNMSSNIERTKSYNQALSYARLMKSSIFGICDRDRLIIYKEENNYFDRFKPIFEKHWLNINDAEIFVQLKLLIGKGIIESKKK
jgi:hypothetical protein